MGKVLAIKQRRLGDTALWTASLEALSDLGFSSIDIAYPTSYKALFESDPRFGNQYELSSDLLSQWNLLKEIRQTRYDAILNFHASSQTAFLTRMAKANVKLIHHHSRTPRYSKFSSTIPHLGMPMSAIERDLNVVRGLGWSGKSPKTKLVVSPKARAKGEIFLANHCKDHSTRRLALSISASRPSKQWPLEYFINLAKALYSSTQIFVFYDSQPTSPLWQILKKWVIAIPTPDLESLLGCLSYMDGFMGADSGVKHIAAALNIPTVTVFGPESIGEWHGYDSSHHKAIQFPVGCRDRDLENPVYAWCGREICPLSSHACLSQILPEQVASEIKTLLSI